MRTKLLKCFWPVMAPAAIGKKPAYDQKLLRMFGSSLVSYWPMDETSGSAMVDASGNGRNGTYTGVDLAHAAGPDGIYVPFFDGINDFASIYSASFDAAFSGDEGSLLAWCKVHSSADYSDSTHHTVFHVGFIGDDHIYFLIQNNGDLSWCHQTGGATIDIRSTDKPVSWFHAGLTWSLSNQRVRAYLNGAQVSTDQAGQTSMSTYMIESQAMVGAFTNTPFIPWHGWLAHCAVLNREATAAEVFQAATI